MLGFPMVARGEMVPGRERPGIRIKRRQHDRAAGLGQGADPRLGKLKRAGKQRVGGGRGGHHDKREPERADRVPVSGLTIAVLAVAREGGGKHLGDPRGGLGEGLTSSPRVIRACRGNDLGRVRVSRHKIRPRRLEICIVRRIG